MKPLTSLSFCLYKSATLTARIIKKSKDNIKKETDELVNIAEESESGISTAKRNFPSFPSTSYESGVLMALKTAFLEIGRFFTKPLFIMLFSIS